MPSSIQLIDEKYRDTIRTFRREVAHFLFPNDIEYYALTLELVDSDGFTIDSFMFPVMPKEIRESEQSLVNIKKTAGGIISLNTNTFIPKEISISGNFGKKFKILLGGDVVGFSGFRFSTEGGNFSKANLKENLSTIKGVFNPRIKTGYGCIRVLNAILEKSQSTDRFGKPYILYLYNPAIGNNYIVEVLSKQIELKEEQNMIHNYSFTLKAVAPLENARITGSDKGSLVNLLAFSKLNQKINNSSKISKRLST